MVEKETLHATFLTLGILILAFISSLIIDLMFDNRFDEQCFNNTATVYCNYINKTLKDYDSKFHDYFNCQEKVYDPRIQDFPGISMYKFLDSEIETCTIKKSWFRRVILKQ